MASGIGAIAGRRIDIAAACGIEAVTVRAADFIEGGAGALTAIMCLVATALGLATTPIGRVGDAIVQAAALPDGFIGTGAVHVGTPFSGPATEYLKDAGAGTFE